MPKRVAIYARFSTDRQDARSIDDQVRRCRRFADERGWSIAEVFADAAQSGASLEREGLQRLLAEARGRRSRFDRVLVDDLSRLSRDLGDTWNLVFGDLEGVGVAVVDVTSGLGSDTPAARVTFGALALVNDMMRQSSRTQTHRGLEGRALAGFHTGGRCYGYRTVPEENPADPMRPRAVLVIDLAEAAIVRRVFEAYAAGAGLREIAAGLNRDGVPAPYDGRGYTKPAGKGWGHSTVRAMLRNERYIGRVTWNRRKWNRGGERKRRLPRARPADEWVTQERPELVIVGRDLWDGAQARLGEGALGRPKGGGRERGAYRTSAVSGLLRCGVCGAGMTISGQVKKAGVTYRTLACSAHLSKGAEVCPNDLRISERKATAALLETVRQSLTPAFRERFAATFRRLWAAAEAAESAPAPGGGDATELRALEAKRDRLVALVEDGHGDVQALLDRLRALEGELRAARARAVAAPPRAEPLPLPDLKAILAQLDELELLLGTDPRAGQAALAARFADTTLTPRETPEGRAYHLETTLKTTPAALVTQDGRKFCGVGGCGGKLSPVEPAPLAVAVLAEIRGVRGSLAPERLIHVRSPWLTRVADLPAVLGVARAEPRAPGNCAAGRL